jgi:hypothetical protein
MAGDDRDELLTLAEAGKRLGRHPEALRALVRRHRLPARRDNLGRLLLRLADLPTNLSAPEHDRAAQPASSEHAQPAQPDPVELLELREELAEERVARARLEGELFARDALLTAKDTLAGELREALARAEARSDRLEAALAEARRPWLAKVLEGLRRKGS